MQKGLGVAGCAGSCSLHTAVFRWGPGTCAGSCTTSSRMPCAMLPATPAEVVGADQKETPSKEMVWCRDWVSGANPAAFPSRPPSWSSWLPSTPESHSPGAVGNWGQPPSEHDARGLLGTVSTLHFGVGDGCLWCLGAGGAVTGCHAPCQWECSETAPLHSEEGCGESWRLDCGSLCGKVYIFSQWPFLPAKDGHQQFSSPHSTPKFCKHYRTKVENAASKKCIYKTQLWGGGGGDGEMQVRHH